MFTADIAAGMKASKMLLGVLKAVRINNFINFTENNSCQFMLESKCCTRSHWLLRSDSE